MAAPFMLFAGPVFVFALLPRLIEWGLLREQVRDYLSRRVFHSEVDYASIDFEGSRRVILTGVEAAAIRGYAGGASIRRAVLHYDDVIPLGRLERLELDGLKLRIDLDRDPPEATPAPDESPWLRSGALELKVKKKLDMPAVDIRNAEVEGILGGRPYRLDGLSLQVRRGRDGVVPFELNGILESGEPMILRGHAGGGELDALLRMPGVHVEASLVDGALEVRANELEITPRLRDVIESLTGGLKLEGRFTSTLRIEREKEPWTGATLEAKLENYSVHYGDFELSGKAPTVVKLSLTRSGDGVELEGRVERLEAPYRAGPVTLRGRASSSPEGWSFAGRIEAKGVELAQFHEETRGEASVALDVEVEPGRRRILARLQAEAVEVRGVRAEGLDLKLPWLQEEDSPESGWIRMSNLHAGESDLGPQSIDLKVSAGRLEVPDGWTLEAWGGSVMLGSLVATWGEAWSVRTSLEVKGVDLEAIGKALESETSIVGRISGRISGLVLTDGGAEGKGSLNGSLYGGDLQVTGISLEDSLLRFDATVKGLSLEQLSKRTRGYGVVHGMVDASARGGWDLATKRPRALELNVRSIDAEGESRFLNVKALRRLYRVMGDRRAEKKLKKFPIDRLYYADLGLYAVVDPDGWVTLRGKFRRLPEFRGFSRVEEYSWEELEAGRVVSPAEEMIVVGGGMHRVNVYLSEPPAQIHLDRLLEELKADE